MKSDLDIRQDVNDELFWELAVGAVTIDVKVNNGVVTLTGHVRSCMGKLTVKHTAERVAGVHGVMQKIEVRLPGAHTDIDIAQTARTAFEWQVILPPNRTEVLIGNGWVTLSDEVDWPYQSGQAAHAVRSLHGVAGLISRLQVKARMAPTSIAEQISAMPK